MDLEKIIINYRISRVGRIIENIFGVLAARFRSFLLLFLALVETVESVTKCYVALHNYLMAGRLTDEGNAYCPNNFVDQEVRGKRKN